jgi:hypothetical protein
MLAVRISSTCSSAVYGHFRHYLAIVKNENGNEGETHWPWGKQSSLRPRFSIIYFTAQTGHYVSEKSTPGLTSSETQLDWESGLPLLVVEIS